MPEVLEIQIQDKTPAPSREGAADRALPRPPALPTHPPRNEPGDHGPPAGLIQPPALPAYPPRTEPGDHGPPSVAPAALAPEREPVQTPLGPLPAVAAVQPVDVPIVTQPAAIAPVEATAAPPPQPIFAPEQKEGPPRAPIPVAMMAPPHVEPEAVAEPVRGPGEGMGLADLVQFQPVIVDLLRQQVEWLSDIDNQLGAGHAPALGAGEGAARGKAEPEGKGASFTGGLAKLGVQGPAAAAQKIQTAGEGGAEVAEALGASEGAIAGLGATCAVAAGVIIGAATGAAIPLGYVALAAHLATDEIKVFGLKLGSAREELAKFSPDLAQAQANKDVNSIIDDFREAQALGPDLARMVESQNVMQRELREAFLPIKQFLLEFVADFMKGVERELLPEMKGSLGAILAVLQETAKILNDAFGDGKIADIPGILKELPAKVKEAYDNAKWHQSPDAVGTDKFLSDLYSARPNDRGGMDRRPIGEDPRPDIPIVGGM